MRHFGWMPVVGLVLLVACGDNGGDVTEPIPTPTPTPTPENVAPTANFGVSCDLLVCTFSDSSSDSDGSVKAWQWSFGDGATATEQNPMHTYAAAQSYTTTLVVTDSAGATGTVSKTAEPQAPPTADLTCTDAAGPGAPASCTVTLPQAAGVLAVLGPPKPCGAVGDVLAFSAPVADTLTSDACFAPAGTQVQLAPSPAGTVVTFEMRGGLTLYSTAVHVTGTYPTWTLNIEDALGAPFDPVPDFTDLIVTLTVVP
jgi:PKD repeat protein